jgi:hypothetical protein
MHNKNTSSVIVMAITALSLVLLPPAAQAQSGPPNYSAFAQAAETQPPARTAARPNLDVTLMDINQPLSMEKTMDVPTFLWAAPQVNSKRATSALTLSTNSAAEKTARRELKRFAGLYRLDQQGLDSAHLLRVDQVGNSGFLVQFNQQAQGVEVFERKMSLLLDPHLDLVSIAGYLSPHLSGPGLLRNAGAPFALTIPQAIAIAFQDLCAEAITPEQLALASKRGAYAYFTLTTPPAQALAHALSQPARAKKVLYELPDRLEPAYYVELQTKPATGGTDNGTNAYAYVIAATDGRLLHRSNLTADINPFAYRVWADDNDLALPQDSALGNDLSPLPQPAPRNWATPVASRLVSVSCGPISTCDPWLPDTAVQTVGNNVDAYADISPPSGFNTGDLRAPLSSPSFFDYPYDFTLDDNEQNSGQLAAAVVQAFYTSNFMHDWLYDHGFDEQAGNAQDQNYGRGGEEVDRMQVEVNDYSGSNNANMTTPLDGAAPTMQLFPFTHDQKSALRIKTAAGSNRYTYSTANFGPGEFWLSGPVVLADDGTDTVTDGCEAPLVNTMDTFNTIVLIDRGACTFVQKVKNAQDAGAAGVIIANNAPGTPTLLGGDDPTIFIPAIHIPMTAGQEIKTALIAASQAGTHVQATFSIQPLPPYNSALDNSIVIHEWAHFMSTRLTGGALWNNQGTSLGEGWSDFLALLAMTREEDRGLKNNNHFQGTFAVGVFAEANNPQSRYFGIRRYPYSTQLNKNPLTFKHISKGVPLPEGVRVAFGSDGLSNPEVHCSGEVWAVMLWEAYVNLLNDNKRLTFTQARDRMLDYLVASLKLTPANPTFLEARNALLAVAKAHDFADYRAFWQAFAKRGAGVNAVGPRRYSLKHNGVVEDFSTP